MSQQLEEYVAGGERILLVEDSPTQALVGRFALESAGFEVVVCATGTEVHHYVRNWSPDLILLDMNLPGMSGQEVAIELKSSPGLATIPIVFLTSVSDPHLIVRGLSIGAKDYLVKPVDDAVLVAHVQATLRDTQNERKLGSLVRRLLTMVTLVAGRLGGMLDPEVLFGQVTRLIQQSFGYACVRVWLAEGDQLKLKATSGAEDDEALQAERLHSLGESGHVASCFVQDVATLGSFPDAAAFAESLESGEAASDQSGAPVRFAVQAVPLHLEGQAYGVLEIFSGRSTRINSHDQLINQALADLVSVAAHDARMYRDMEVLANKDVLTGIPNRRAIMDFLEAEWRRCTRYKSPLGVCLIDIDHFKEVNDVFGHAAGDEVLRAVAGQLQAGLRSVDRVGRIGGDEFLIVFPETSSEGAVVVSERLLARCVSLGFRAGEDDFSVTLSMGVASWPEYETGDAGSLLLAGDRALYQAKAAGRNQVRSQLSS